MTAGSGSQYLPLGSWFLVYCSSYSEWNREEYHPNRLVEIVGHALVHPCYASGESQKL